MIGARRYHMLFCGKSQQLGQLYLRFGSINSINTFEIYVLPRGTLVDGNFSEKKYPRAVKVYGPLDGKLIGTGNGCFEQAYGWLEFGKWQNDFELIVADKEAERERFLEEERTRAKKRAMEGAKDKHAVLAGYSDPF